MMKCAKYCIHRIPNKSTSNTYIVSIDNNSIIIDPGSLYSEELLNYLNTNNLLISYIILTHEHYDHCIGVNYLRKKYSNVKLVASYFCNQNIQDDRMNLSRYADENGNGFTIRPADIVIDRNSNLDILGLSFHFLLTPGHSQGSMCFWFDNVFFSGDMLIPGHPVVCKLKGSNKNDLQKSLVQITDILNSANFIIFPGHL